MQANKKRLRVLKGCTVAACVLALAASSVAGARPAPPDALVTVHHSAAVLHPHGRPALFANTSKTDVRSSQHTQAPDQPPVAITREVRTVTDYGDRTLAIVLAAAALGVALCGTGYAAARLANLQRRVAGSSS
ncbi:MAG: hypothetical protein ACXVRH_15310 [Thermoleophilaceae bacterium]